MVTTLTENIGRDEQRLQKDISLLDERLSALVSLAERFDDETNDVVRWSADLVSNAGRYEDAYESDITTARRHLASAKDEFRNGDSNASALYFKMASRYLDRARNYWGDYLRVSGGGSRLAGASLHGTKFDSTCTLIAGGVGLAIAGPEIALASAASAAIHGWMLSPLTQPEWIKERNEIPGLSLPITETLMDREQNTDDLSHPVSSYDLIASFRGPPKRKRRPKPLEAVINEAIRELELWRHDPDRRPDFGRFMIDAEAELYPQEFDEEAYTTLVERWNSLRSELRSLVPEDARQTEAGVYDALRYLHRNSCLMGWRKGYGRMVDLLSCNWADCAPKGAFIATPLAACDIGLPWPNVRALQNYRDHLAAVNYNRQTGEVWDLQTGFREPCPKGDVYDMHILYWAFLHGLGITPPVAAEELLLARAETDEIHPFFDLDANDQVAAKAGPRFVYPDSKNYYSYSLNPDESYYYPNYMNPELPPVEDAAVSIEGAVLEETATNVVATYAADSPDLPDEVKRWIDRNYGSKGWNFRYVIILDSSIKIKWQEIVFRRGEIKGLYEDLPEGEARRQFLLVLAAREITEILGSRHVDTSRMVLDDPSRIKDISDSDLDSIGNIHRKIDGIIQSIRFTFRWALNGEYPSDYITALLFEEKNSEYTIRNALHRLVPRLKSFDDMYDRFWRRIADHPKEFLLFADRFDRKNRERLLELVDNLHMWGSSKALATNSLMEAISDPDQVGIRSETGATAPKGAQIVWVSLTDGLLDGPSRPAEVHISPEFMLELIFLGGFVREEVIRRRWNSTLSRALLERMRSGEHFINIDYIYRHMNSVYPPEAKSLEYQKGWCDRYKRMDRYFKKTFCGEPQAVSEDIAAIVNEFLRIYT